MKEKLMRDKLETWDEAYAIGMPEVSDLEYDNLKNAFREEFPNSPYLTKVGAPVVGEKVKLPVVLGSLNKVKTDGSCQEWMKKNPGEKVYWAKLDGVSGLVEYVDGQYTRALTRGDGEYGQDITEKLRNAVPQQLKFPTTGSYRAEIMLVGDSHKQLGYKTRRNGTAGILNRDGVEQCEHLVVLFYELVDDSTFEEITQNVNEFGRIMRMKSLGLAVAPYTVDDNKSDDELVELLRNWKSENEFDIDGIVITLDASEREDTYYPDLKVAFKVNEEATIVEVVGVTWQVGRTGRVIPVVNIVPTEIGGVTVSNSTGFNADFIFGNGIGTGAKVGIYRSGDVIPYIDCVVESVEVDENINCPSCGYPLTRKGVDVVCQDMKCPDQQYLRMEHFLRTLGAENITAVTLKKLDIATYVAAYELDELEISMMDGFGIKRGEQIVMEIQKTLKTTPDKILAAIGIPGVGRTQAQNILKVYDIDEVLTLGVSDLVKVDGIGDVLAENIVDNIPGLEYALETMRGYGLKWATAANTLRGKVFCLTGNGHIKRDVMTKLIESNGGYVKGMSKKVDYLVTNDPESNTGKAKKARELGKPIISYFDVENMMED